MESKETQKIFARISRVLRHKKWLVLLVTLVVLAPIIYYNETTEPVYEASSLLVFEEFSGPVHTYEYDVSREIQITNQLEEVGSLSFAEDIARSLGANVIRKFNISPERAGKIDTIRYISERVQKNISAFPVRNSNIVSLSVKMSDPLLCTAVANVAAVKFQERSFKIRQQGVSNVRKFIEEQLVRYSTLLEESENVLKNFKQKQSITSIDKESQEILRRLTEAEVLYNSVKASRGSTEERIQSIEQKLAQQKKDLVPAITQIGSSWSQKLKDKLIDLQLQYMELSIQNYPSDHPKMVQLQQDIDITKKRMRDEALKLAQGENLVDPISQMEKFVSEILTQQIELETQKAQETVLLKTINEYNNTLRTLPEKEYNLARLTRDREVSQKLYMMLLEKLEEAKITEAENTSNIRIIDEAQMPKSPVSPRKRFNLAIGLVLGVIFGLGVAFLTELKNSQVESIEDLEKLTKWSVLATIPSIDMVSNGKHKTVDKSQRKLFKNIRTKRGLISSLEPKSAAAEGYRMLRTNLQFLGLGESYRTILVTSNSPGEGKSTTIANLAITLANLGNQVLIVDADVRVPTLHTIFNVKAEPGLGDLLKGIIKYINNMEPASEEKALIRDITGKSELSFLRDIHKESDDNFILDALGEAWNQISPSVSDLLQATNIDNLSILTSGSKLEYPGELITRKVMKPILQYFKNNFDIVLIDSAPLLLIPDTLVISSLVDVVLLVLDENRFDEQMLLQAKNRLRNAKANVMGIILNKLEQSTIYKKYSYYYTSN